MPPITPDYVPDVRGYFPHRPVVVFCDFDGTVSQEETFAAMLKRESPVLAAQLLPEILAMRLSLREGVRRILESIESIHLPAIADRLRDCPLRAGYPEFLAFLRSRGIPYVLVSGGLRVMVERALEPHREQIDAIYAVEADPSGPTLAIHCAFEGGDELMAKTMVMERHPCDISVAIGDSVTDWHMAHKATHVFARDRLAKLMTEAGLPFEAWDDFHHIQKRLQEILDADSTGA